MCLYDSRLLYLQLAEIYFTGSKYIIHVYCFAVEASSACRSNVPGSILSLNWLAFSRSTTMAPTLNNNGLISHDALAWVPV